ncbi:hypothetical protein [Telmatospirillum sp. J64-1]|uniref:hypothetical protein n=1 Tax=Telmatospirillum sp. J64-1 TaxID=2502183 RepID=UPI00115F47C3|nr:hypothetical protein [Telmatospirillum sp. J64-1]
MLITILLILIVCILLFGAAAVKGVFVRLFGLLAGICAVLLVGVALGGAKELFESKEVRLCREALNEVWPGERKITDISHHMNDRYYPKKISVSLWLSEKGEEQVMYCDYIKESFWRTSLTKVGYSHNRDGAEKVGLAESLIRRELK